MNTVIMPKQGLQMTEGTITQWLVPVGGHAVAGDPLFEMETDKLTITINSDFTGTLLKVLAEEGDVVPITAPIAFIGENGEALPDTPNVVKPAPAQTAPAISTVAPAASTVPAISSVPSKPVTHKIPNFAAPAERGRVFATPRAKTRAAERGIEISAVVGSGPDGLVTERDVIAYVPTAAIVLQHEKLWINADFSAAAALIARSHMLDTEKFIARALVAALKLSPVLANAFGDTPAVEVAVGIDGFEPVQSSAEASLTVAINTVNKATLTICCTDQSLRGDAVKLLGTLKEFCESPELALCI